MDNLVTLSHSNGAKIIVASWGGANTKPIGLERALQAFGAAGGIFVNAALNFGTNLDQSPLYPASLKLPNMLVVGAVDEQLQRAGYSCYGAYVADFVDPSPVGEQRLRVFGSCWFIERLSCFILITQCDRGRVCSGVQHPLHGAPFFLQRCGGWVLPAAQWHQHGCTPCSGANCTAHGMKCTMTLHAL